jgi:hypothetical protein
MQCLPYVYSSLLALTVGQDFKVQLANIAVSCYKVHAMFIFALASGRGVSLEINRALRVSTAISIIQRRTVLAHVLHSIGGDKGIEILPVCWPSRLQVRRIRDSTRGSVGRHSSKKKSISTRCLGLLTHVSKSLQTTLSQSAGPKLRFSKSVLS